jgi:hypothetical protein
MYAMCIKCKLQIDCVWVQNERLLHSISAKGIMEFARTNNTKTEAGAFGGDNENSVLKLQALELEARSSKLEAAACDCCLLRRTLLLPGACRAVPVKITIAHGRCKGGKCCFSIGTTFPGPWPALMLSPSKPAFFSPPKLAMEAWPFPLRTAASE